MNRLVLLVSDQSTTVAEYSGAFHFWRGGWSDGDSFSLFSAGPGFLIYGEPLPRQLPGGSRPPAGEEFDGEVLLRGAHEMLAGLEGGRRLTILWVADSPAARADTIRELGELGEVLDRNTVRRTAVGGGEDAASATQPDRHDGPEPNESTADDNWMRLLSKAASARSADTSVDTGLGKEAEPEVEADAFPSSPFGIGGKAGKSVPPSGVAGCVSVLVFCLVALAVVGSALYGLTWVGIKAVSAVQEALVDDEVEEAGATPPSSTPDDPDDSGGGGTSPGQGVGARLEPWDSVFAVGVCSAGPDPEAGNRVVVMDCADDRASFTTVSVYREPTDQDACPVATEGLRVRGMLVCRASIIR